VGCCTSVGGGRTYDLILVLCLVADTCPTTRLLNISFDFAWEIVGVVTVTWCGDDLERMFYVGVG
jgi:hypothetical protein